MKKFHRFVLTLILTLVTVFGIVSLPTQTSAQTAPQPVPRNVAQCTGLGGGPNSAHTGETSWDFTVGVNYNGADRSTVQYQYQYTDSRGSVHRFARSTVSSKRIEFPGAGTYTVQATIYTGTQTSTCSKQITIGRIATCNALVGGPNGAQAGVVDWDFVLSYNRNDARSDELKFHYVAKKDGQTVYDKTDLSSSERIRFPGPGTYVVSARVLTGSKASSYCNKTITITRPSTTPQPTPSPSVSCTGVSQTRNAGLTRNFNVNVQLNGISATSLTYRFTVTNSANQVIYNNTSNLSGRQITFPAHGNYQLVATVIHNNTHYTCPTLQVVISQTTTVTPVSDSNNNTASSESNNTGSSSSTSTTTTAQVAQASTTTPVPNVLPNTGAVSIAIVGGSSLLGYVINLVRRKFF